jgi:cell division FtsZ-interacting protein ZapD
MGRCSLLFAMAALYFAIGIVTFGHSAAGQQVWRDTHCATVKQRVDAPGTVCYDDVGIAALGSALVWPLYWSWELQS